MNINNIFTPRRDPKPDADVRPDSNMALRSTSRAERSDALARRSRVRDTDDDTTAERVARAKSRAQFSAMLAALAGVDGNMPSAALPESSPADDALLDRLLNGSLGASDGELRSDDALQTTSDAADALQYRLRGTAAAGDRPAANMSGLARTDGEALGLQRDAMHTRINEVIGRIVARRGTSVEDFKALGDDRAANLLVALDALLSKAGTPAGLELADASARAALEAAMTALRSASAASAADVTTAVREVEGLAPALQARLGRVIDRMKSEYGHDVSVVETVRSQERQDFLYEQGRTRPGAVVTWTRDSAHLSGDAVDVLVDGSWTNAEGFGRLQRIAQEEGLRTLGVRDPGHLELPRDERRNAAGGGLASKALLSTSPVQSVIATTAAQSAGAQSAGARSAGVQSVDAQSSGAASGVARVAGVAQAAAVARVADASGARRFTGTYATPSDNAGPVTQTAGVVPTAVDSGAASRQSSGEAAHDESTSDRKSSPGSARSSDGSTPPAFGATHGATPIASASDVTPVATPAGAQSAERVADVQQLRENAPAGSVSRMTLNVDTPDGGQDRITVDLRGATVDTHISTDAANADRLRVRTAELQDALGRHGLEGDSVRISGTPRTDATEAARVVAGERDGVRFGGAQQGAPGDGATSQGQRERAANAREWDRPESSRQSRDEQRESSKRGAGQPGQRETYNGSDR